MFNVRVISHSKPAIGVELKDDLLQMVAYCARVSNPSNQNNEASAEKLVNYLIKHQHWSPLEMVSVCMEVDTTRDIARQILRHRSFSFQEFSQRYADPTKDLSFVIREARLQDDKNRQNSVDIPMEDSIHHIWESYQEVIIERCKHAYEWAITAGIAKEQARAISRMYVNGTLRSWIHYIQLRASNGTQKEHQEIAKACAEAIYQIFPLDDVI